MPSVRIGKDPTCGQRATHSFFARHTSSHRRQRFIGCERNWISFAKGQWHVSAHVTRNSIMNGRFDLAQTYRTHITNDSTCILSIASASKMDFNHNTEIKSYWRRKSHFYLVDSAPPYLAQYRSILFRPSGIDFLSFRRTSSRWVLSKSSNTRILIACWLLGL